MISESIEEILSITEVVEEIEGITISNNESGEENDSITEIVKKIEGISISNDESALTQAISASSIIDSLENSDAPSSLKLEHTPKKGLDVTSNNETVFSTPIGALKMCCNDATCAVCLSPLLQRSVIETRCKVK
jgi:hypothetical protein